MILLFFILLIDFLATGEDKYPLVINDSEKFARKRHWPFLSGLKCFPSLKTGEHQKAPFSQIDGKLKRNGRGPSYTNRQANHLVFNVLGIFK